MKSHTMENTHPLQRDVYKYINLTKYVIIKMGTNLLNEKNSDFIKKITKDIADIKKKVPNIIIVSSGAVGLGLKEINIKKSKNFLTLKEKQGCASIGQSILINKYNKYFRKHKIHISQILLSKSDFEHRVHYSNLKNTFDQLLSWGVIPIINENDAVSTEELKLGDNDTLSGYIASMFSKSLLLVLTNVNGFQINGETLKYSTQIKRDFFQHLRKASKEGIGGMQTKLQTAELILQSAQVMNIANGYEKNILKRLLEAESIGTWFINPKNKPLSAKKRWILYNKNIAAKISIDEGALKAIMNNTSLLLVGIIKDININSFNKNEILLIKYKNTTIAKGLAHISQKELLHRLEKNNNRNIELIHKDNLVLLS